MTTATLTDARVGGLGFTGLGLEYDPTGPVGTPGTAVVPTDFIPGMSNTLKPSMARYIAKVQSNNPFAERINVPQILTCEGTETFDLNAALGLMHFYACLGASADLSLITSATTGTATTTNGLTTLPGITGAFLPGALVTVNTGASMELTTVVSYSSGVSLIVHELKINAACVSTTAVKQIAQTKYAWSLLSGAAKFARPLLTVERNIGGSWSWQFPSCYVEGLDFTIGQGGCAVAAKYYGTAYPKPLNSGSSPVMAAYAPSTGDEATALKPFTGLNGIITIAGDPSGSGTSAVVAAIGMKDAKITFDGGLVKFPVVGNSVMQAIPGDSASLKISWNEVDTAHRPAIFDDYVSKANGVAFNFAYGRNFATASSPSYKGASLYVPNAVIDDSALNDPIGSEVTFANTATGMVLPALPADLLQIYIAK